MLPTFQWINLITRHLKVSHLHFTLMLQLYRLLLHASQIKRLFRMAYRVEVETKLRHFNVNWSLDTMSLDVHLGNRINYLTLIAINSQIIPLSLSWHT